ncbi:MAG: ABC transporter permease subunit [Anaerolineaceae bacterium]|nr:ABC transporter permease subunit [Anaerolineaceae bacterium]MCY3936518.1 ABC transporter permease subunit [Chloroflexota bacterium]MCY4009252.1 ABC transporter permease subunit [Anaerolineaceae bacterium]MCY4106408.1 ABC transporter permease subunit [Chloroflexota bacterium]
MNVRWNASGFARWGRWNVLLLELLVFVLIWEWVAAQLGEPALPPPSAVLREFWHERAILWRHLLVSARRVLLSVAFSIGIGAPLAILAASSPKLDRALSPLFYFFHPVPKVVFLPILLLLVGLGEDSKLLLMTAILVFQIYVIVRDAAKQVPAQTLDSMASLGADRWQLLRFVYVPVSLPAIVTALKVSVAIAIAVLYIAEQTGSLEGLGAYIKNQFQMVQYAKVYSGALAMSALGLAGFALLSVLESRVTRWQRIELED